MVEINYSTNIFLPNEAATLQLGASFSRLFENITTLYLYGEPGAGKTTFSRGFIQALGHQGKVKSPTYTLVEPYQVSERKLYHFDLYRLVNVEELEFIGIHDYLSEGSCCIIEWPEKGEGLLPKPNFSLTFICEDDGRRAFINTFTASDTLILKKICF